MSALADKGLVEQVLQVWNTVSVPMLRLFGKVMERAEQEGSIEPDVGMYNICLKACHKAGLEAVAARMDTLWNRMRCATCDCLECLPTVMSVPHRERNIHPDYVSYGSRIHGMAMQGDTHGALWLLDEMSQRGLTPNEVFGLPAYTFGSFCPARSVWGVPCMRVRYGLCIRVAECDVIATRVQVAVDCNSAWKLFFRIKQTQQPSVVCLELMHHGLDAHNVECRQCTQPSSTAVHEQKMAEGHYLHYKTWSRPVMHSCLVAQRV